MTVLIATQHPPHVLFVPSSLSRKAGPLIEGGPFPPPYYSSIYTRYLAYVISHARHSQPKSYPSPARACDSGPKQLRQARRSHGGADPEHFSNQPCVSRASPRIRTSGRQPPSSYEYSYCISLLGHRSNEIPGACRTMMRQYKTRSSTCDRSIIRRTACKDAFRRNPRSHSCCCTSMDDQK